MTISHNRGEKMNLFIINTNKSTSSRYEQEMLEEKKCAAYRSTKGEIAKIKKGDKVLLYSNQVGIVAKGMADGKVMKKEDNGEPDAEYYMHLNDFYKYDQPIPYNQIFKIIQQTDSSFKRPFSVTAIKFSFPSSKKIWDEVSHIGQKHTGKMATNTEKIIGETQIFNNWDDANWAFNFIYDMVTRLGIEGPGDRRLAVTYRKDQKSIHINFCSWLLLGFYRDKKKETYVDIPLTISNELDDYQKSLPFKKSETERPIALYTIPLVEVQSPPDHVKNNYKDTIEYITRLFEQHESSPYRIHNQEKLEQAIFNQEVRDDLFMNGFEQVFEEEHECQYFWLTSKPSIWSVSEITKGETVFYTAYNERGNKRRIFSAFQSARPKDKIIFYESTPRKEIVALGEVVEGLHKEKHDGFSEPIEGVSFRYIRDIKPISWSQIIDVKELEESSPVNNGAQGSLFELTKKEYETILSLEEPDEEGVPTEKVQTIDFTSPISIGSLYFEDEDIIKKRIQTALKNGKHIIFTGPPGTGKSKLAKEICRSFNVEYRMTTATSDWSTYETIGGNRPEADGTLTFHPGLFLSCFKNQHTYQAQNQWLIIDEMNRADIDKAFGSFFSALTGDDITLPYSTQSENQVVLRTQKAGQLIAKNDYDYFIPKDWRLIGTMNTFDKASLYEMSYAFMRRFAFIPIGIPKNITENVVESYLALWEIADYEYLVQLTDTWKLINKYRQIGPAIVEDIAMFTQEEGDFTSAIILYVMPQFEGLMDTDIIEFVRSLDVLDEVDVEQLLRFTYDFFQIKE